ncbi:MAG TPA: YCF48-related protein [Burkholderiaceae bacterium]|nr:YCF48-related protein [Burkholderiaceae bacterium]
MNRFSRAAAGAMAGVTFTLLMAATAAAAPFADPLDTAAIASALAPRALLNGLAHAGARIVAVGQRGHVLYSDDQGGHWRQASVPVSTDLVALVFPTATEGWAVGHDSVVLHSGDAGATWERQFDGRKDAEAGDKPLLDVWFDQQGHGLAVGAFGLALRSDDGGKSWQHWESHLENPKALHLNAIRAVGGALYIVGEQGLILKRSADGQRFEAVASPYHGSFFGVTGTPGSLLVFGLRGTALHSADGGKSWQRADTGTQTGLTAGLALDGGALLLVSQAGQLLRSADGGATFRALAQVKPGPASAALVAAPGQLLIAGARGVRLQALDATPSPK